MKILKYYIVKPTSISLCMHLEMLIPMSIAVNTYWAFLTNTKTEILLSVHFNYNYSKILNSAVCL